MVLFPIVYCRISPLLPGMDDRLKELHPKEILDIFSGMRTPFIANVSN